MWSRFTAEKHYFSKHQQTIPAKFQKSDTQNWLCSLLFLCGQKLKQKNIFRISTKRSRKKAG